jgi:hypothetical protein
MRTGQRWDGYRRVSCLVSRAFGGQVADSDQSMCAQEWVEAVLDTDKPKKKKKKKKSKAAAVTEAAGSGVPTPAAA